MTKPALPADLADSLDPATILVRGATGSPHDETCEALFMTSGFVPGRTARSGTRPRAAHRSSEIRPPSTAGSACLLPSAVRAICSSCASWSDTRFNVTVKSRPARDSLIRRKNSLMARISSLQGRINFPVPMRRELDRKLLYLALHSEPIAALGGPGEQNSLYFPS